MARREGVRPGGYQQAIEIGGRRHTQEAACIVDPLHDAVGIIECAQQRGDPLVIGSPFRRQPERSRRSLQQTNAQPPFEPCNALGDGRWT